MSQIKFTYSAPAVDGKPADAVFPLGATIADMAKSLGPCVRAAWILDFDGSWQRVPIDLWHRVRPKKDGIVHFDVRMGKKAFKVIGIVAAVATAIVAPYLGAALATTLGFTGTLATSIATAAVGYGLNMLANSLFASGSRSGGIGAIFDNDAAKTNYARVDTDNNLLGRDAYLPRVFGEARISPPDVINPNYYVDRGAQAIERVLAVDGYNTIHNVFIDGTPVVETVNLIGDAIYFEDQNIWTQSASADISSGISAPDGSEDGRKILSNTTSAAAKTISHTLSGLARRDRVDFSIYAKAGEEDFIRIALSDTQFGQTTDYAAAVIDLTDGSIAVGPTTGGEAVLHDLTVIDAGNGWWSITLSATLSDTSTSAVYLQTSLCDGSGTVNFASASTGDGAYIWNASAPTRRDMPSVSATVRQGAPNETTVVPVRRITKPVSSSGDIPSFVVDDRKLEDQQTPQNSSPTAYRLIVRAMPKASEMTLRMVISGLADIKDPDNKVRIPLRIRYRPVGDKDGAWINLPEIHFTGIELGRRMFELRIRRELQGFVGEDVGGVISHVFWREVPPVTAHTLADGTQGRTQWRAHSIFAGGSGLQQVKNVFSVRHGVRVIVPDNKFLPMQDYEFDILRGAGVLDTDINADYQISGDVVSLFVARRESDEWVVPVGQNNFQGAIGILNAAAVRDGVHPVQKPGTSVICLQSRNQSIRNVTAHVTGMAKDWDGSGWNTWVATRNPALCARQLLEDALRYARVAEYSSNPRIAALAESALDNTDWLGWKAQCEKMGASCSVVTAGQTLRETLLEILGAGLARPAFGDKLRIDYFRDRTAEVPVITFSPRNADGVRIIYESPRRPMGMRATFRDRQRAWQERELEVRAPIYGDVQNWDAARYENIDDAEWLRARVIFDMLRAHHWRVRYEITTDLEGMALKPGTLVGLVTDLVDDQSYGARVREVLQDGRLVLDNVLPTVTEQILMDDIGDRFELEDILTTYDQAYALLTTPTGADLRAVTGLEGNIITPDTPFDSADLVGTHVSIGPLSTRLRRCIVVEEQAAGEFSKTVTLADEAPQIYEYMKNTFGWSD